MKHVKGAMEMVRACRYFTPPTKYHKTWHCHMGLQRSGDCHIFLGKARVCDFKWAPEEKMAKKKGDVWILSDNGGLL
jgi:hypothetical protein